MTEASYSNPLPNPVLPPPSSLPPIFERGSCPEEESSDLPPLAVGNFFGMTSSSTSSEGNNHHSSESSCSAASTTRRRATPPTIEVISASEEGHDEQEYKSYTQRWFILLTVLLLSMGNYAHWISYASVLSKAAAFYNRPRSDIQMIMTVSYALGFPACCLATLVLARFGLRVGLYFGAFFTVSGGLLCCLSTLPGLRDLTGQPAWYWMTLVGQGLTGLGSPFLSAIPTKVSQHWFSEGQRTAATSVLGLAAPMGMVLGQAVTPLLVATPSDIPTMNILWFCPALLGGVFTLAFVTRARPPSPPSRSAALETEQEEMGFWGNMKGIARVWQYWILVLVVGGAMGYISAQQIKNEPVLCSLGYSNTFSGASASLVFLGGVLGSIALGIMFAKCKTNSVLLAKILCVPLAGVMTAMIFVTDLPDVEEAIVAVYFCLGFLSIGIYPMMLEFAVEATFPHDESIVTAIIILSSSLQGVGIMEADDLLVKELTEEQLVERWEERGINETCTQTFSNTTSSFTPTLAKDHTAYVAFLNGYGIVLLVLFVVAFRTRMKRTEANQGRVFPGDEKSVDQSEATVDMENGSVYEVSSTVRL